MPDVRDYSPTHPKVLPLLSRLSSSKGIPTEVDLRSHCEDEPNELFHNWDQGSLNDSGAFAVLSLVEYFEGICLGRTMVGSRLFLYKTTRNLSQHRGNTGCSLRATIKALVSFGVPPESYCPYDESNFDSEPSGFLYRLAKSPRDLRYFRLDQPNHHGRRTLEVVRAFLAAGFPVAFGFPVPMMLPKAGHIPIMHSDSFRGGQAVVAIGYTKRFLLIRSSWGQSWGQDGCGWLPNQFVEKQLARDFWTMISSRWLESNELCRPYDVDFQRA